MSENKDSFGIKHWAEEDRPREKLLLKGKANLTDAELIAIILGSGNDQDNAVELSRKILLSVKNNLFELGKLSIKDLQVFRGIGEVKAITLLAALELGRRRQKSEGLEKPLVKTSKDVFEYVQAYLSDLNHERFMVIFLNKGEKITGHEILSIGGVSSTVVDVKLLLKLAIEKLASSIIIAHNHPSGNLKPSEHDKKITDSLNAACSFVDITLKDHLIVGENNYYSFADEGRM